VIFCQILPDSPVTSVSISFTVLSTTGSLKDWTNDAAILLVNDSISHAEEHDVVDRSVERLDELGHAADATRDTNADRAETDDDDDHGRDDEADGDAGISLSRAPTGSFRPDL
jgi:hypothetical protein